MIMRYLELIEEVNLNAEKMALDLSVADSFFDGRLFPVRRQVEMEEEAGGVVIGNSNGALSVSDVMVKWGAPERQKRPIGGFERGFGSFCGRRRRGHI